MKSRTTKDREKAHKEAGKVWDEVFSAYREGTDTLDLWRKAAEASEILGILKAQEMEEWLEVRARQVKVRKAGTP